MISYSTTLRFFAVHPRALCGVAIALAFLLGAATAAADDPPVRPVRRVNWWYAVPGLAATGVGIAASTAFGISVEADATEADYLGSSYSGPRSSTIVVGLIGIGHLAVGLPVLVRGLIGERVPARAASGGPRGSFAPGRYVQWGYVVPGIVTTSLGAALAASTGAVTGGEYCGPDGCDVGGGLYFMTALGSGIGHLVVGIPLIIKGAVGEVLDADGLPVAAHVTIEPMLGPGQVGVRGTF